MDQSESPETEDVDDWQSYELVESIRNPLTGQQLWQCTQCDFTSGATNKVKEHVENHIAGVEDQDNNHVSGDHQSMIIRLESGDGYQCSVCHKTATTRKTLKTHIQSVHIIEEPSPCEHCGKQFKNNHTLRNHISLTHKSGSLYICDICNKRCLNSANLYIHGRQAHNMSAQHKTFMDEYQEKNERLFMIEAMITKLGDGTGYMCTKCDKVAKDKGNLKKHVIGMHMPETANYCKICGKKFKNEHRLANHISRHRHPHLSQDCNICGKTLRNGAIYKHLKAHNEDPNFTFRALAQKPRRLPKKKNLEEVQLNISREENECDIGNLFDIDHDEKGLVPEKTEAADPTQFNAVSLDIEPQETSSIIKNDLKQIKDLGCGDKLEEVKMDMEYVDEIEEVDSYQENEGRRRTSLMIQLPDKGEWQCVICNYRMVDKGNLKKHCRKQHLEEFLLCEKNFKEENKKDIQRGALIESMITNIEGTSNFTCTKCGKMTSGKVGKGNMKKHIISTHMPKEYEESKECNLCGKLFKNEKSLANHESIIHRGTVQECEVCAKVLINQKALSKHMKKVHQMKSIKPKYQIKSHSNSEDLLKMEEDEDELLMEENKALMEETEDFTGVDYHDDYDSDSDTNKQKFVENKLTKEDKSIVEEIDVRKEADIDDDSDGEEQYGGEGESDARALGDNSVVCGDGRKDLDNSLKNMVMRIVGDTTKWSCNQCGKYQFRDRSAAKAHAKSHLSSDITSLPCTICRKPFKSKKSLSSHCSRYHPPDYNGEARDDNSVEKKLENNKIEEVVNNSTEDDDILRPEQYMERLQNNDGYKCSVCGKLASDKGNLKKHILSRHFLNHKTDLNDLFIRIYDDNESDKQNFKCLKCPRVLAQETGMRRHIVLMHAKEIYKNVDFHKEKPNKPLKVKEPKQSRKYFKVKKHRISLDDPKIRASFESGGAGSLTGVMWTCGVEGCEESFSMAYNLKEHYWRHDKSIGKSSYECDSCSFNTDTLRSMKLHMEEMHPDRLFIKNGDSKWTRWTENKGYKMKESEKWKNFIKETNLLLEINPHFKSHDSAREWEHKEEIDVFPTISAHCDICQENFNTQNAFDDHSKVHNADVVKFTCEKCKEVFAVESVFKNHKKSHTILYSKLKTGVIRCNGCSQHFQRDNIKKHLSEHHLKLLDKCHFCEQCSEFFTFRNALKNHMFTHAEQVFRCPICPTKMFLTQEEQEKHIAQNKCKAKYKGNNCNYCGKSFTDESLLVLHKMKIHQESHNGQQFQCMKGCGGRFSKSGLTRHMGTCKGLAKEDDGEGELRMVQLVMLICHYGLTCPYPVFYTVFFHPLILFLQQTRAS